VSEQKGVR